jgi:hypothetical protein
VTNDDGFEPYWLDEPDWLVAIAMLPNDEPEESILPDLNWIGNLCAFAQVTNTRMLALVGDPDVPTYELLFSFTSEENKQHFLELVKLDGYADPEEENTFTVPERSEIADARPVGMVFPENHTEYITRVATVTVIGLQTDEENADA